MAERLLRYANFTNSPRHCGNMNVKIHSVIHKIATNEGNFQISVLVLLFSWTLIHIFFSVIMYMEKRFNYMTE